MVAPPLHWWYPYIQPSWNSNPNHPIGFWRPNRQVSDLDRKTSSSKVQGPYAKKTEVKTYLLPRQFQDPAVHIHQVAEVCYLMPCAWKQIVHILVGNMDNRPTNYPFLQHPLDNHHEDQCIEISSIILKWSANITCDKLDITIQLPLICMKAR